MSKKVQIYACGGAGMNVVQDISKYTDRTDDEGYATVDICFIDTSKSNLKSNIDPSKCFILDDLDGSGKNRRSNYQVLSETSKKILLDYQPGDLNVLVHSSAGGELVA